MCYDLSFLAKLTAIVQQFPTIEFDEQVQINYNASMHIVAHSFGEHPIIYQNREDQHLHVKLMEWGCIPYYIKDEQAFLKQRIMMLNARSERVLGDTSSYWYKIRNRRCLIPVTGIFEHRKIEKWTKKVPYFIHQKNQDLFFLPGLYSVAELPNKETGELEKRWSYTLITRAANDLMKQIHNDGENKWRMPLFLPMDLAKEWVDSELNSERMQTILNYEMPAADLESWPVFTIRTSKERPDGKQKTEPYVWEGLTELN
ncbi:MAG: SOS response-associated peptidase family protein [Bacteroidota bacterium]